MSSSSRKISPSPEHLDKLRQPLTDGEVAVFQIFDDTLNKDWEIYLQPHLNGLRPDFVLLNPNVGIAVYEVKDSDFSHIEIDEKTNTPLLKDPSARRYIFNAQMRIKNAIDQLQLYKHELSQLYCPRLDEKAALAVITAGLVFPNTPDAILHGLLLSMKVPSDIRKWTHYYPIIGKTTLEEKMINRILPESSRRSSFFLNEDKAADLRAWLIEPDFAAAQRRPLILDRKQKELVRTRTPSGYRRIKGPAGSGKSLVLAARASELASQGKTIGVFAYNITLLHYLRDLCVRWKPTDDPQLNRITWINFHMFCRRMCILAGYKEQYDGIWRGHFESVDGVEDRNEEQRSLKDVLTNGLPELMFNLFKNGLPTGIPPLDAILVDEGQDFLPSWWNVLRLFVSEKGELLLAADTTQDIYGISPSWTDRAMIGAGFPGGTWSSLETSYRLPNSVVPYVKEFAEKFMGETEVDLPNPKPQDEFDLEPTSLRWVQCNEDQAALVCVKEIRELIPKGHSADLAFPEVIFLCANTSFGREIVQILSDKGIRSLNTFDKDRRKSRKQKIGFFMGDARVKATSVHSFKGWESRALVIYVDDAGSKRGRSLVYTGLTRLKASSLGSFLTVVCSDPSLYKFGKNWPDTQGFDQ